MQTNIFPTGWLAKIGSQARALFQRLHRAVVASEGPQAATAMHGLDPQRYLDPAILARVGFSPLLAKVVVEGFLSGLHKSPFHAPIIITSSVSRKRPTCAAISCSITPRRWPTAPAC
jgi:hypothetical protein